MDRLRINDEDLDKIFNETDVNHDGRLSYDELEVPKIDTIFLFIKKK
jgi:Ca2+-binding EF-hand superfamily protein